MNKKALEILEYPKIIRRLAEFAGSEPGKEKCRALVPSDNIDVIRRMQCETTDAVSRIFRFGHPSFSGLFDIRPLQKRLEIGSVLTSEELLHICSVMETAGQIKTWSSPDNPTSAQPDENDSLEERFRALQPLSQTTREIRRCILSEEEISDDASTGLRKIRRQIRQTNEKIHSSLNAYLSGPDRAYLQDSVITQRDGRSCIPVKAEYRTQVPGMIHDQSASGSTVFIEPMTVVKLNNDLRELEIREQKEIDLVLAALSEMVSKHREELYTDFHLLTELDFIFARASLSISYNGTEPKFNTEGRICIKKGRHPLLDPSTVVPVDIRLGSDFTMLVISGPNTGGKTVSLKTVGLFTLLGQAGLHIPAAENSELAVFRKVYADIGDEQSIEQSLSTFSSHMKNIVSFWKHADEHSLVLFDELGAGTDPDEGAALAIAILSDLHRRNIRTIATTHYSDLKVFALSTPGVENGCCEFNVDTLQPTYRLLIGVPGKSNAFAISEKLGLPKEVISEAKTHLSEQQENLEDVITQLEEERASLEKKQEDISQYAQDLAIQQQKLSQKESSLEEEHNAIILKAREEAQEILTDAKNYADDSVRRIKKLGKSADASAEMEQERSNLRKKLSSNSHELNKKSAQQEQKKLDAGDLTIGDTVRVRSLNLSGSVVTKPDQKGNLFVQMGALRSQVNLKDLEKEKASPEVRSKNHRKVSESTKIQGNKSSGISAELNLIGKTADEAIAELDKYLDDASLAHLSPVRIVHGKGSGTLRKAVHRYLRSQSRVASFRLGEFGEGDSGVTIVELQ